MNTEVTSVIIAVQKFQRFNWLRGVQLIIDFCVTRRNTHLGPAELQNAKNNHGNSICVSKKCNLYFLCKQKQTLEEVSGSGRSTVMRRINIFKGRNE